MNIARIPQRVEIVFWCTVIPMMKGTSQLQNGLNALVDFFQVYRPRTFLVKIAAWAIGGLTLGFSLGVLASILH